MLEIVPCRLPLDDVEDEPGVEEPAEIVGDVLVFCELATRRRLLMRSPMSSVALFVRVPPLLPLESGISKQFFVFFRECDRVAVLIPPLSLHGLYGRVELAVRDRRNESIELLNASYLRLKRVS